MVIRGMTLWFSIQVRLKSEKSNFLMRATFHRKIWIPVLYYHHETVLSSEREKKKSHNLTRLSWDLKKLLPQMLAHWLILWRYKFILKQYQQETADGQIACKCFYITVYIHQDISTLTWAMSFSSNVWN